MRVLAENMAYLLRNLEAGEAANVALPEKSEECDSYVCVLKQGEYLLLCTDGLINTVSDQEILYEVIHNGDEESCLDRMLAISKSRGAADNVTAVLLKVE